MKKLIFVFVALFMLVLVSGCGAHQNTIRYDNADDGTETEAADEEIAETGEADETSEAGTKSEDKKTVTPTGKLAVTSFDGAFLKTNLSYNVVKGTVSSDTSKITINNYKLTKYVPGQTQWDYIASTRFNTLKDGLNSYVLKTYNNEGVQTDSLIFSIDYEAPVIPEALPGVGASHWLALIVSLMLTGSYVIFRKYKWL
ncbi:hypothetical protein JXD20_03010 [Candidatus Peregrinibacteria bacterium]|nr:hypothetical protein [Candidatus Peregrinibacteria bacterium]